MKNSFLLALIFMTFSTFSQETYTMKSGGRVFNSKNERVHSGKVAENFNQEALKLYQAGRAKKTFGNILLWGGVGTIVLKHIAVMNEPMILDLYGNTPRPKTNITLYAAGSVMILAAIPIKIGFQKKIRKSVAIMNAAAANSDKTEIESTSIIANSDGLGLKFTF